MQSIGLDDRLYLLNIAYLYYAAIRSSGRLGEIFDNILEINDF